MELLTLDSRKRLSLGDLAKHHWYAAEVDGDGVITLTPVQPIALSLLEERAQERINLLNQLSNARHERDEFLQDRNALEAKVDDCMDTIRALERNR